MKTNMQESSLEAYDELRNSPKLGNQQQTILNNLRHGRDYSLREIQKITGFEINVVSGRVNDLKKLNLLIETKKRQCSVTGKTILPVRWPAKQEDLFA